MQRSLEDQIRSLAERNVVASTQAADDSSLTPYPTSPQRGRRSAVLLAAAAVMVVVVAVTLLIRSWDESDSPYVGTGPTTTAQAEFCPMMAAGADVPEAYIGTAQHRADVAALLAAAPPELKSQLQVLLDYLDTGAVKVDEPDTKLIDNWPPEVQNAAAELSRYSEDICGVHVPG